MTEADLKEIEARAATARGINNAVRSVEPMHALGDLVSVCLEDIPDLVAALREARDLLAALMHEDINAFYPYEEGVCIYCDMLDYGETGYRGNHKPNCPWLLAKQYLDPMPQ